jgi:transcriptional regulatory protein RtcR
VRVSFAKPARDAFVRYAETAPWPANFRDFNAALRRMATLADGGRIDQATVTAEIARIGHHTGRTDELAAILGDREIDRFDRVQLADVVEVCRASPSLSAAGRTLFASSLATRTTKNDADRLRKYLARFGLDFAMFGE